MSEYDPSVIRQHAERLYRSAKGSVAAWVFLGAIVGGVLGLWRAEETQTPKTHAPMFIAIAAFIGYFVGRDRAFRMRLQAQMALCQAQIEENTRTSKAA